MTVLKIFREEFADVKTEFRRLKNSVEVYRNGDLIRKIKVAELADMEEKILRGIKNGGSNGTFEIDGADKILATLALKKITASSKKSDIVDLNLQIRFK